LCGDAVPVPADGRDDAVWCEELTAKRSGERESDKGFRLLRIIGSGDRPGRCGLVFRFSLLLLFLLLLNSFVQAHLWKHRPFHAIDTDHSGGDHICDLRRDSNGDGKPDRLGDCVSLSGTVIAEPSTYETGGWIFWIRDQPCGVMVYGEQETFRLGDSVVVTGWVRHTNGNLFFPQTGLATLGDVAIENGGTAFEGRTYCREPVVVTPDRFCRTPEAYGGNLVRLESLIATPAACHDDGDHFVKLHRGQDTLVLYVDRDTGCPTYPGPYSCVSVTGIVIRLKVPCSFTPSPTWCVAPRCAEDLVIRGWSTCVSKMPWGGVKAGFSPNH
jgi:hypothetical protein